MGAKIFLVDESAQRRAQITYGLRDTAMHVEPFASFHDVLAYPGKSAPDAVVLIHDTEREMVELVAGMRRGNCWFAHIAYSSEPSVRRVVAALSGGAIGYLSLPFEPEELESMIADNADRIARQHRAAEARSRIEKLTSRERDVLAGVAEGLSNRAIADRLAISARTVEIHRANLLRKIEVPHTFGAIRVAIEAEY